MRILVDFRFPLEPFNSMVKNGTAGQKIEQVMGDIKPEAVYFTERDGKRGGTMIVDLPDPSKIPAIAEPLFLAFDAAVNFHPVMTPDDLAKAGLEELGKSYA
jgi:hypothetical protein